MERGIIEAAGGLLWREAAQGRELALVHRPRYDDWSLPKGKLKAGERWQDAAVREVEEETNCPVRLGEFAGCIGYTVEEAPKVVLFWHMAVTGRCAFRADHEVDELRWLPVAEALATMTYPAERRLVRKAVE